MTVKQWRAVHTWTSLVCSVFLLLACVTGLPLVFADAIDQWLSPKIYADVMPGTAKPGLDKLVDISRRMYPGQVITSVNLDDEAPQAWVWMAPGFDVLRRQPDLEHFVRFDVRTGNVLDTSQPTKQDSPSLVGVVLRLHRDLFAGLSGELLLGAMAACFVASLVSGVVLYGPFMKKLHFGTLRHGKKSPRLRWLDLHNLLGIATLGWMAVVGVTGLFNELSTPLFSLWQRTEVQPLLGAPPHGARSTDQSALASPQAVADAVERALPGMVMVSVAYPGAEGGSPSHFFAWAKGTQRVSSRLFSAALVDAHTARVVAIPTMPWYLRALEVARPLHFGDYAGLPLKLLWVVLDIVAIVVLGSGIYLWLERRRHG